GGGLIWLAMPPTVDAGAGRVRSRLEAHSAHASLVRASAEIRAGVDVFQPQSAGLTALSQRLKASFDPDDILNRGRMARSAGP
ncbi:hypothetical protein, partial [Clostridioides difficile]|uniref:hypothetical protein n=1 Tax=Clostridioides difficile TaxID=1496 RepID=UPI001A9B54B9